MAVLNSLQKIEPSGFLEQLKRPDVAECGGVHLHLYVFDQENGIKGNVAGWDERRTFEIKVRNTRDIPAKIEIRRNFNTSYWTLTKGGDIDAFEKVDIDTVKFTLALPSRSRKTFEYTLTTYEGARREDWNRLSR